MAEMKKKFAAVAATAALALIGLTGCGDTAEETAAKEAAAEVQAAEKAAEKEAADQEVNALAQAIQAGVEESFPEGVEKPALVAAFTEYEPMSKSTIRVHVQETLTKEQRAEAARFVFNMGGYSVPELTTLVVRDATGVDSNHYR